jgi:NADH:ubiquinone oxidoreductase subunit E
MKRVGVFICHCGRNISANIDIEKLVKEIKEYPGVVHCEDYKYMCSDPGQVMIKERLRESNLDSIVVASCSPLLHEVTFRRAVAEAGLNPYLLEMANIREQCSWIHADTEEATKKAIEIIKATVEKAKYNDALEPAKIPVNPRALVLGGGIAGIQAALDIANSGYEVVLVERTPSIGGHMAQLSETFPTLDCSQCILTPKMVDVGHHKNLKLHTYSEIEELSGYAGNYRVKIKKKPRSIDFEKCTGCGDCWNYCPVLNKPELRERPSVREKLDPTVLHRLDAIIDTNACRRENIISILQDITAEYNWLHRDAIDYVAERLEVPFSYVYRIASFFTQFSLKPRGKHVIRVCLGTACFVRGAPKIISQIQSDLGIAPGETTEDGLFTLETVNCLGACALGPLMVVDQKYHGRMKPTKILSMLKSYNGDGK